MKTDDLISALTADLPHRPTPVSRALLIAAAAGIPIALAILMLVLHPRDDFWQALASPRFLYK
ncbi:NrsF family protein, partial [Acinetobacter baumannii]